MKNTLFWISITFMVVLFSCDTWDDHYGGESSDNQNLLQVLESTNGAAHFVEALKKTNLDKIVSNDEIYTVFVPPAGAFDNLDDTALFQAVGNHIMFTRNYTENMTDSLKLRAASGRFYTITKIDDKIFVNNRKSLIEITGSIINKEARNGVIHSVDALIETVPGILDNIALLDKDKYSIFLEYYNKYDSLHPEEKMYTLNFADDGGVILTESPMQIFLSFNTNDEANDYTLLVPSNEAILKQRAKLVELNGGYEEKMSPYYYSRLIRNQMLRGAYSKNELFIADTIFSVGNNWVVGKRMTPANYQQDYMVSNGYIFESSEVIYKPIAVDFIDSIVYEAEWCTGINGHPKTLIYEAENEPVVDGNGVTINHHLNATSLLRGNNIQFFIPNVYRGVYQLKLQYKWSDIRVNITSEESTISPNAIDMDDNGYIVKDINNQDPNYWAYGHIGYVYLPETGYLNVNFEVESGFYSSLKIDKVVLIPLEYQLDNPREFKKQN